MSKLKLSFAHHAASVENMERSIAWYSKLFDAEVYFDQHSSQFGAPLNCRVVIMRAGEVEFELFEYQGKDWQPVPALSRDSTTDPRICGNKHDCFVVDDMRRFVMERVVPYHVHIDHGPERQGDNWQLFITDPDGAQIELYDIGGAARDPHAFDHFPCKLFQETEEEA